MKILKTYEVYVLGVTSSGSTVPPFSTATRLPNFVYEIPVDDYITTYNAVELVTQWNAGVPIYNSTGISYNNAYPFSNNKIIGFRPYYPLFLYKSQEIISAMDRLSVLSYNLQDYLSLPSTTGNYLWIAFASADKFIPICYQLQDTTARGRGWTLSASAPNGIYKRSDNSLVFSTYRAPFLLPLIAEMWGASGSWNLSFYTLHYSNSQWIAHNIRAGDPSFYAFNFKCRDDYGGTVYSITAPELIDFLNSLPTEYTNPYEDGGTSTESEGGTGSFDDTTDVVLAPPLPSTNVSNAGFVRIYNPTLTELQNLANYMWTDTTFLQTVVNHAKQLLENPIESVIALNILPCPIPEGTPESVKVLFINTGVTMAPATTQFVDVDCGSYTLKEYYGSALDYSPYTRVHCYLPYIGQVTLDTDEVMGKTISIKYRIDIVTGMCVALISVGGSILYQFSGHCAISMPLTSADFSTYFAAALQAAKIATGVVAGAAGASDVAASLIGAAPSRSSTTTTKTTERNPQTGRQVTAGTSSTYRESSGASFGEMAVKSVSNTVNTVMNSKPIVEHTGGFTGNSGYLAVRRPYLIIEIPRMCNPEDYGKYNGYPSMLTLTLSECEGYTKVQEIHLTGFSATNPEMSEIAELLKGGVVF